MTTATATPLAERVSELDAREELSKFFVIAQMAETAPGMFSKFIDAEWHQLAETPVYDDFCMQAVGHKVAHAPINGEGEVTWVEMYHQQFGDLPAAWFADENGIVDTDAYGGYLNTRTVRASWNCSPTSDPDFTTCPNK